MKWCNLAGQILIVSCFLFPKNLAALTGLSQKEAGDTLVNKARFWGITGGIAAIYSGSMVALNEYWYKDYERSSFHFFNDMKEWQQMDKAGHMFSAYFIAQWSHGLYQWTGLSKNGSVWASFVTANVLMSGIELLDGFSAKWGASLGDLGANLLGSGLYFGQQMAWNQQRISIKYSTHIPAYPANLEQRVTSLFGTSLPEKILKDYNGATVWLSTNIASFLPPGSKFPKWLNLAFGYGSEGLLGGYENKWCSNPGLAPGNCDPANLTDRTDIPRYRQWFLSPDIDLTRINVGSKWLKTTFKILNVIKIPAPTLEWNTDSGFSFHFIYF